MKELNFPLLMLAGITLMAAGILPPIYFLYVHHKTFCNSTGINPHNSESLGGNSADDMIHTNHFEILASQLTFAVRSRGTEIPIPGTPSAATTSVNNDPISDSADEFE